MNINQQSLQPQPDHSSDVVGKEPELFPIVGIGASAGGLEAFTQLLEHLPNDTGMGFVLVQHLDPNHKSLLTEILSRKTQMPVLEVTDSMVVKPNHVYIIPPNKKMILAQGVLRLTAREKTQGKYMSVDSLFYSLASERGDKAVGVVLSGEDGDGSLGLEAIKEAGGITFAQSENSAKANSMPHNAAAIGGVDFILPPSEIALELAKLRFFAEASYGIAQVQSDEDNLNQIFTLLRTATGIDFTNYKHPTLKRQIQRRLVINKKSLEDYVIYLQENPTEVQALSQDFLIHVTSFFRDPEVFVALKNQVFPRITENKSQAEPIRIWVPGCSTGEEVYSIAICLLEFLDGQTLPKIQIFATDISESAIDKARSGYYIHSLLETVSPLRLQRFFIPVEGGYQISKSVRQMCVFAKQNLSADPPFSKLDLISCRNVLIYLSPSLQQKVIPLFHYSLKPTGFLLLGTSESTGDFSDLFAVVNKKQKIYERKLAPSQLNFHFFNSNYSLKTVSEKKITEYASADLDLQSLADQIVWKKYAPPGVVINSDMEILQFRGETSPYLGLAPGKPNFNLLKMAQPSLRLELRAAIKQAKQQNISVKKFGIQDTSLEQLGNISFEVIPILTPSLEQYFLVLFESVPLSATPIVERTDVLRPQTAIEQELNQLKQELATNKQELAGTRDYLQSIIQEQELANQEMMTANEEILSSNEEYQSTNEELETAKEEIQSTNEELNTTNEELSERIIESNRLNNDLSNLLSSVSIPIIMVSNDLCIRRFTPMAEKIFNLIPADVGRPLNHINHNLHLPQLEQLIREVIDIQLMKAQEVQDRDGHWYDLRIRPYKTTENQIDGAVLVLVDIDSQKRSNMRIQASRDEAEAARLTAEAATLAKDEFLSVVSHELRNPLTSILGWSQLLRRRQFDAAQTAKALETIEHNAQSQAHLIEDLLDISRITTGKLKLNVNVIALAPVIEEAINVTRISANAKNIQIESCVPTETLNVSGDPDRLQQILWNLISNAIKFTPVGGRVTVKLEKEREFAQIQVSDTGQGISAEFLPYVFERFRQADSRSTRKHSGLGLGLSIVYHLVELHGGQVSVESLGEGQGTTITVRLPLQVPVNASLPSDSPLLSQINPVMPLDITLTLSGLGVLVVDDDAALRQLLKIIIQQYGGTVTTAASAQEAISVLTGNPGAYNVLLSDIGMPNEDGYALIEQVRALSAECGGEIPAAALSGYVSAQQQRESLAAGFQRHIAKPVATDQLVSVIAELGGLSKNAK